MVIPAVAAGAMAAMGFIGPMFVHSIFSIIIGASPLTEASRQYFNRIYPLAIPGPGDLVREHLLGKIDRATFDDLMKRNGFDEGHASLILEGAEQLMSASELVFANFRGIIPDNE